MVYYILPVYLFIMDKISMANKRYKSNFVTIPLQSNLLYSLASILLICILFIIFSKLGIYFDLDLDTILQISERPMTGVRCPTCAANGQESWVIPGRACGYCGTGC